MKTRNNFDNERQFSQKLSNIFLGEKSVKVKSNPFHLARVTVETKEIFFAFHKIFKRLDPFKEMMTFKGLLFHEVHHLKHTVNSRKLKYSPNNIQRLIGILEDGRVETLGVLKYEKLADYFIYSVNNVLLKEKKRILKNKYNEIINNYLLCYGRKIFWQDMKLLEKMREIMVGIYGHDIIEAVERLIDKYQFEKSSNKRIEIAEAIHKLLASIKANPNYDDGKGNSSQLDSGRADPKTMSKDLKELGKLLAKAEIVSIEIGNELRENTKDAKDFSKERLEEIEDDKQELMDMKNESNKLYDKMKGAKTDKTYEKYRKKVDEQNKKITEKREEVDSGSGYSPEGSTDLHLELSIMINNKEDEQEELVEKNEDDLLQDLKSSGHSLDGIYADSSFDVDEDMELKSRELERGLKKLSTELVKGYVGKQKSGRLNIKSFLNRKDVTNFKVFKKYIPDRIKETKILLNLYIDGSGSMQGIERWGKALKSMWVINDALNKDQNKVMAYQFSTDFIRFKDYNKPLTIPKMLNGGTYPAFAIEDSIPIIEKYKKTHGFANVIDIIITDGEFSIGGNADKQIEILNKLGHETILINISYSGSKHGAKHLIVLDNFDELVPELMKIFMKVKKTLIKKAKVM